MPFGMSPHALNSAALHPPARRDSSPPTQHVSAMGFAAGMQHAAAAAAAAAVQLGAQPAVCQFTRGAGTDLAAGFVGDRTSPRTSPARSRAGERARRRVGWIAGSGVYFRFPHSRAAVAPAQRRGRGQRGDGTRRRGVARRRQSGRRAGGWGSENGPWKQFSDHEAWDDELLFEADGVGGGGGVASTSGSGAGGLSVGATGTAPGATTSGVGGGWPSKGGARRRNAANLRGDVQSVGAQLALRGDDGSPTAAASISGAGGEAAAMANNFQALAQFGSPQQQAHLAQQFQHQVGLNPMSSQQRQLAVQMQLQQHQQQMYGGSPQREIRGSHPRSDENLATEGVDACPSSTNFRHGRRASRRTVASARASKTRET